MPYRWWQAAHEVAPGDKLADSPQGRLPLAAVPPEPAPSTPMGEQRQGSDPKRSRDLAQAPGLFLFAITPSLTTHR